MATNNQDIWNLVYVGIAGWVLLLLIIFVMPIAVRQWLRKRQR